WPLRVENIRKLLVFDHRCLRDIAGVCWDHRVSNSEVRRSVLGNGGESVDEVVNLHRLRWLGHVLRMPEHRLPRRSMLTGVRDDIVGTDTEDDFDDLKAIAELERKQRNVQREALEKKLLSLLLPTDERDLNSAVIMELFAGAGGKEAGLFAHDLMNMYHAFAIQRNWSFTVLHKTVMSNEECAPSHNETSLSYVRIEIEGEPTTESGIMSFGAYGQLKWEAGVHRVQRVPVTSSQNKIHTSTVAVSIQPKYGDVDIDIPDNDLKWEFHRPTGPGGQNVNKLHEIHSKSQSHLIDSIRRSHLGNLDRSEKIRTYNFPQDRITDHRLNNSWNNLYRFMKQAVGLSEVIESLYKQDQRERLKRKLCTGDIKS
ncbi:unnamed protein product, partial [Schistosoma mattheei]